MNGALEKIGVDPLDSWAASAGAEGSETSATNGNAPLDAPRFSRSNPFRAALLGSRKLNGPGSDKDTRHFEVGLSGLEYEPGDALGVVPTNCPEAVDDLLEVLRFSGDETVPGRENSAIGLRDALLREYEITKIPLPFLKAMAERSGDKSLKNLAAPDSNGELSKFLFGREILDLLLAHPAVRFTPAEFVALLKKLPPRLYSIASSPRAHPDQAHLTVNILRYESLGRGRKGVCSNFLADRVSPETPLPVFIQANNNFRLPPDGNTPIIMVGPGTGIAPFRAFLQERQTTGARGRNWLFYGDQRVATDFMYRDELEAMARRGMLTRLDTAFSRDQPEKIYVQHRMREQARDLFGWLEEGAHFYVCGEASRMAKDVDTALHQVIEAVGDKNSDDAKAYVAKLAADKRYQRDVY